MSFVIHKSSILFIFLAIDSKLIRVLYVNIKGVINK